MAQENNYSKVDLRVGTEAQFNAKVDTLPAGTLFGITDATVSKADLSTDLKNEINGKINKPANPSADSAIVISSTGTISTKVLTDIAGKSEVSVSEDTPSGDEILWINPSGTGGGSSSGGGKVYLHKLNIYAEGDVYGNFFLELYSSSSTPYQYSQLFEIFTANNYYSCAFNGSFGEGVATIDFASSIAFNAVTLTQSGNNIQAKQFNQVTPVSVTDTVTEL